VEITSGGSSHVMVGPGADRRYFIVQNMNVTAENNAMKQDAQPGGENLMPKRRTWGFPQEAWPALVEFAPETSVELQLRFDEAAYGSDERRKIQVEIEKLIERFVESASPLLADQRKHDFVRAGEFVKVMRIFEKQLRGTMKMDLTLTEMERLHRLADQQISKSMVRLHKALKALQV
jgi:hypothetical protein